MLRSRRSRSSGRTIGRYHGPLLEQSKDLATENPDKVKELVQAWNDEARKNLVLPLDDRTAIELVKVERPSVEPARDRHIY
jgi:hypothetical protein